MYDIGDCIEIFGLKSKPQWNGKHAIITDNFNWDKGRYPIEVQINDPSNINKALLKPTNMKFISKNNINTCNDDDVKQNDITYFKLIKTSLKGFGLVALCDIPSGTVIFNDKPLLRIPRNKNNKTSQECIIEQYKLLSDNDKQKVLSYHIQIDHPPNTSNNEETNVLGIYYTNGFTIINDLSDICSGFFPIIARMNHSCLSNCEVLKYDLNSLSRDIITLFDVKKGDELTINYIGNTYYTLSMEYNVRKEYILSNFNFNCACNCCIKYNEIIENNRKQFGLYQDIIDENVNNFNKKSFKLVLNSSNKMIEILNKYFNGYPTILSQCYMNAAHAQLFLSEYQKSINYIKKSIKIDQKYYGNKAQFDDVKDCLSQIPSKYHSQYPWNHVLNLT